MDKEQVKVLSCPLCPEGKMYLMKKPCDDCEHLKVCKYYQAKLNQYEEENNALRGACIKYEGNIDDYIKVLRERKQLRTKLSHYEDKLDKGKIEGVIDDSKLYQGFQCDDYTIRIGLKKNLAQALLDYLKEGKWHK